MLNTENNKKFWDDLFNKKERGIINNYMFYVVLGVFVKTKNREPFSSINLAKQINISHDSSYKYLNKLSELGYLNEPKKGVFKKAIETEEIFELKVVFDFLRKRKDKSISFYILLGLLKAYSHEKMRKVILIKNKISESQFNKAIKRMNSEKIIYKKNEEICITTSNFS